MLRMDRKPDHVFDELLVLESQDGDVDALKKLIDRWQPRLLRHATRRIGDPEAARDVVQEAWVGIIKSLRRLQDPARFPAWAYTIVARKAANWIQRRQRERKINESAASESESSQRPQTNNEVNRLRDALRRLPANQRELLTLYYVEGLTVPEIADVLGIPAGTVKSRLFHSRQQLKSAIERTQP